VTARPFAVAALLTALASARSALAVSPLVVDDADTVERGRLQVNAGWQILRTEPVTAQAASVNPVGGLGGRAGLGATFGYQWRQGSGAAADTRGVTDLAFATKLRLWGTADDAFKVSTRLDLKVPTASEARGLGTGNTDVGLTVIATRCWKSTCLDANGGYTAVDGSRLVFGDDQYFLGLAAGHERPSRWTVIGETYAVLSNGSRGGPAALHFDVGAQLAATGDLLLSILVGSALGRDSPDFTGYVGFTWVI
jgi:hypothetical protein